MARIMVVDDAAFMRMMLRNMLIELGHDVICEASNGVEAVERYGEMKPDLVTLDITMPEMDGIEAAKAIKAMDAGANIIMCSAMGQQGMVVQAIQAGAKDFVVKPFQKDRVNDAIQKVIG